MENKLRAIQNIKTPYNGGHKTQHFRRFNAVLSINMGKDKTNTMSKIFISLYGREKGINIFNANKIQFNVLTMAILYPFWISIFNETVSYNGLFLNKYVLNVSIECRTLHPLSFPN